jgi:hypothetical protein
MTVVTRSALRITIYNVLLEAITMSRVFKQSEVDNEYYSGVTKIEVTNFIESNPYFDEMLKTFLKDKFIEDVDAIIVSEEWKIEFVRLVKQWADNFEWSYGDISSEVKVNTSIEI